MVVPMLLDKFHQVKLLLQFLVTFLDESSFLGIWVAVCDDLYLFDETKIHVIVCAVNNRTFCCFYLEDGVDSFDLKADLRVVWKNESCKEQEYLLNTANVGDH